MPKKPIDYSKTIIYNFDCKDLNVKDLYVGHTTNWKQRKKCHKQCCINNTDYNSKVYKIMRENGGWDNWEMIEIEKYPCNDEREASARERYFYEQLHADLNTFVPMRTEEERKELDRKSSNEYRSRPGVKEKQNEYSKKYREENKEILSEKKKEYHQKNKIKKNQYCKEYHHENKEKISLRRKQKITCSCGSYIRKSDIKKHERSKKHQQYIEAVSVIQRVDEILNQDMNTP